MCQSMAFSFLFIFQISRAPPANLTTNMTSRLVLTQLPSSCASGKVSLSPITPSLWPLTQPGCLSNISQTATTRELGSFPTLSPSVESTHCHNPDKHHIPSACTTFPPFSSSSSLSCIHPSSTQIQPVPQAPKLVPIFKNKVLSRHVNVTKILAERQLKQAQAHNQNTSGSVIMKPHHAASSSSSSSSSTLVTPTQSFTQPTLQRVTLPFCRNQKKEYGVSVSAPQQPVSKTQPVTMHEVPSKRKVSKGPPQKQFYRVSTQYCLVCKMNSLNL